LLELSDDHHARVERLATGIVEAEASALLGGLVLCVLNVEAGWIVGLW
jgi:hypothetical protein